MIGALRSAGCALSLAAFGCSAGTCRGAADPGERAPPSATPGLAPSAAPAAAPDGGPDAAAAPDPAADAAQSAAAEALLAVIEPLRDGGRTRKVRAPDADEERAFQAWLGDAAAAATTGGPPPAKPPAGFSLKPLPDLGVWLVAEKPKRRRGAGAYVLRLGGAAPLVVEAPHTFYDQGTLPIAVEIFTALRARALFVNTAHRYGGGEKPDAGPPPESDVAHAERSFFLAAHKALLERAGRLATVQPHGFEDDSARDVAVIASAAGTGADLGPLLAPLRAALPDDTVRAYPDEIDTLGGETNVMATWSARAGAPFYHLEMSRSLRDRLVSDAALRRRFAAAFSGVATPTPTP